jgi:rubrerythrin
MELAPRLDRMDITPVLDRCIAIERAAGEVYDLLARRCGPDPDLRSFWNAMADDERDHARNLSEWRALLAAEPSAPRPMAEGFEADVGALERLVTEARADAAAAESEEEAFAVALKLEMSELDAIYMALLEGSPGARAADGERLAALQRHEIGTHHLALARTVRRRSHDEQNLTRAALLAAREDTATALRRS